MKRLCLLALAVAACTDSPSDLDLAASDPDITNTPKTDGPGWETSSTLHEGARILDHASANSRRVHSLWISGSNMNHVPLIVEARAADAQSGTVRIAVLGPLDTATRTRPVLAADGYAQEKRDAAVSLDISQPGEHLVVVGSYNLATDTSYDLHAACPGPDGCGVSRYDVLATPKDGALVGDSTRSLSLILGDALVGHETDIDVELWASPPLRPWQAAKIATTTTSGMQLDATVPASVREGDDLTLVVRETGGRILDTGVTTRFVPNLHSFARLDSMIYGDIASLQIAGVVGYYEGVADMRLYSETREMELAHTTLHTDRPGQEGNGYNSFDAQFLPDPSVAPHDGELLSVGFINGNGDYHRLGCFEYCNNLSGLSSCTGGERTCP